jgi:hypothetical protein
VVENKKVTFTIWNNTFAVIWRLYNVVKTTVNQYFNILDVSCFFVKEIFCFYKSSIFWRFDGFDSCFSISFRISLHGICVHKCLYLLCSPNSLRKNRPSCQTVNCILKSNKTSAKLSSSVTTWFDSSLTIQKVLSIAIDIVNYKQLPMIS